MREILFRGKQPNGKWMQGDLTQFCIDEEITTKISSHEVKATLNGLRVVTYTNDVLPETIGQYTGLTDIIGKKIFEGDVVKTNNSFYECFWDDGNFEFGLKNHIESFSLAYAPHYIKVVGTIYDYPELVKQEETK